jgi:hypothetical protein
MMFGMQSLFALSVLVDEYAALLADLDLDGDEQEEYSTVLLYLQTQVEGGTPNETFVERCLIWLERFTPTLPPPPAHGNAA